MQILRRRWLRTGLRAGLLLLLAGMAWAADGLPGGRLQSIESAEQAASFATHALPVVIRGIVIFNHHRVILQDRTGAAEVRPDGATLLALGDEVEVTGQIAANAPALVQHAQVRRLWGGSMPLPYSMTSDQAAGGENEYSLVQTEGELVDLSPAGLTGVRLILRGAHQNFAAVLPSDSMSGELSDRILQPGARLRLTGVLTINHDPSQTRNSAFTLLLRSPDDIQLIEPPTWWTPVHILLLAGLAVILVLIGINGYFRIKHARYRAVAEERASIARDIHDSVAQGYAGVALQLEAATMLLSQDPQRARALLQEALKLVRHSRDESHLSIDILRSLSRNDRLEVLVARSMQRLQPVSAARMELHVEGSPQPLRYQMINNLFRIAQEAMANAVHHARASRIVVRVEYERRAVVLTVEDDGCGFDPEQAPRADEGHYGLTGIRERCQVHEGELDIKSGDQGTWMRVRVAL